MIIVVIQFVVITKGATRISEVAARFALDGMPGKQMAIDADLNAGIIDEKEAQRRREEITQQADFYGAMDGASKFVRGDAIAGIIITVINIVGGLVIGVLQQGMEFADAAKSSRSSPSATVWSAKSRRSSSRSPPACSPRAARRSPTCRTNSSAALQPAAGAGGGRRLPGRADLHQPAEDAAADARRGLHRPVADADYRKKGSAALRRRKTKRLPRSKSRKSGSKIFSPSTRWRSNSASG